MTEYTPTTDEVIRSFSIPAHRVVERKDDESFADYLSRASIEGHKSQMESEAAARRWLAEHDAQLVEKLADEFESKTVKVELNGDSLEARWWRGANQGRAGVIASMRARAAEIREGTK